MVIPLCGFRSLCGKAVCTDLVSVPVYHFSNLRTRGSRPGFALIANLVKLAPQNSPCPPSLLPSFSHLSYLEEAALLYHERPYYFAFLSFAH